MRDEITCPHCKRGNVRRWRKETGEFVHDFAESLDPEGRIRRVGHTICQDDPKWKAKQQNG